MSVFLTFTASRDVIIVVEMHCQLTSWAVLYNYILWVCTQEDPVASSSPSLLPFSPFPSYSPPTLSSIHPSQLAIGSKE